jgi:hypothetical protein
MEEEKMNADGRRESGVLRKGERAKPVVSILHSAFRPPHWGSPRIPE